MWFRLVYFPELCFTFFEVVLAVLRVALFELSVGPSSTSIFSL